jgi:hypothetical protein
MTLVGASLATPAIMFYEIGCNLECGGLTPLSRSPARRAADFNGVLFVQETVRQASPEKSGVKPPHSKVRPSSGV